MGKTEDTNAVDRAGVGVTLDSWTDSYRKVSSLCLTIHYVKEEGLVESPLCTAQFDREPKKTTMNVRSAIYKALQVDDLSSRVVHIVFVTDRAAALKFHTQLDYMAHVLDTVMGQ